MISNINHYEYTDAVAPVSGRSFGDSMYPRLEEREWLNELVRTAEVRGSFSPGKRQASYDLDYRTSKNAVYRMCPEYTLAEDAVSRINSVLTVPYYDLSPYVSYNKPRTDFSKAGNQRLNWYNAWWSDWTANDFLAALDSEGLKITPAGTSWTAGMTPSRSLADSAITSSVRIRCTRRMGGMLYRTSCATCYRFSDWFDAYSTQKWTRDDGVEIGPDADGLPFLLYKPFGHVVRHNATCYFKASIPTVYTGGWNNTYVYDGDYNYDIVNGNWRYSNGRIDTAYSASVQFLTLYRVMHCAVWRCWSASSPSRTTWSIDKYYNVRHVICSDNNYALHYAFRDSSGNTNLDVPASVKTIGDTIVSQYGVANWPAYEPLITPELEEADTSPFGYQVYIEPSLIVATGGPAERNIGS